MFAAVNACLRRAQQQPHRLEHVFNAAATQQLRAASTHSQATTRNKASKAVPTVKGSPAKKPFAPKSLAARKPFTAGKSRSPGKPLGGKTAATFGKPIQAGKKSSPGRLSTAKAVGGKKTFASKAKPAVSRSPTSRSSSSSSSPKPNKPFTPTITARGHGKQQVLVPLKKTSGAKKFAAPKTFTKLTRSSFAVPVPSTESTSATQVPAVPEVLQHPYYIPRNSNGHLPVYTDVRNAGSRYLVMIKNVEGDAQSLARDISQTLFPAGTPEANYFRIESSANKKLVMRGGFWKVPVTEWLLKKGF